MTLAAGSSFRISAWSGTSSLSHGSLLDAGVYARAHDIVMRSEFVVENNMSINPQQTSSNTPTIELITSVEAIPGVTEKQATELRQLGLRCVADLLLHMPLRYEDVYEPCTIGQVSQIVEQSGGEAPGILTTTGEIDQVQLRFGRRKRVLLGPISWGRAGERRLYLALQGFGR